MNRLGTVFKAKANKMVDKAEDPREVLDLSYSQMQDMLRQAKGGIADVAAAKKRIEMQATDHKAKVDKLHSQAQAALQQGREDLAEKALQRRALILEEIHGLQPSFEKLADKETKLIANKDALERKIQAFATEKETLKATYTAAQAQTRVNEALAGIGESMGDVGVALQRARDKTTDAESKAAGLEDLIQRGALEDLTGGSGDDIDRELAQLSASNNVSSELAAMKAALGTGTETKKIAPNSEGTK